MSTRFHDKWHAANHFSVSANGIPDAGRDPVASYKFPFEGEFIMNNSPRNGGHGGYDEQTIENEWILSSNRIDANTIRSQQDDDHAQITLSARNGASDSFVTVEYKDGNETDERTGNQTEHTSGHKEENVDDYRKLTVGGYNISTVAGNNTFNNKSDFTETTTGNHVEDVTGTNTVTITGKNTFNNKNDFEETTTGNHVETVNGTNDVTVAGNNMFTNKANLVEGTSGNYTETIAGERTEHTTKSSHRTVGTNPKQYSENIYFSSGKYEETVNGVRCETTNGDSESTVTGDYEESIGGARTENTTGNATYNTTGNEVKNNGGTLDVNVASDTTVNTGESRSIYLNDSTSIDHGGNVFTKEITVSSNDGYNPWYEHGSIHMRDGMTETPRLSAVRVDSTSAFIDYLSAASADIHQVDIQIYELSGYDISGTDTTRVVPQQLPKGSRMWFTDTGLWVDSWFKLNGDENVSGNSVIGGNETVRGNITGESDFFLSGNSTVAKDSTVFWNQTVHKDINGGENFYLSGDSFVQGDSTVSGDQTVFGNITGKSNANVSGVLMVENDTLLENNLIVLKDTTLSGNESVAGNIVGQSNLTVHNDASISGNERVAGNSWVYNNLTVGKNAIIEELAMAPSGIIDHLDSNEAKIKHLNCTSGDFDDLNAETLSAKNATIETELVSSLSATEVSAVSVRPTQIVMNPVLIGSDALEQLGDQKEAVWPFLENTVIIGNTAGMVFSGAPDGHGAIVIGKDSKGYTDSVAIGLGAQVVKNNAIQIGTGTNNASGTVQFNSYPMLTADGKIPNQRFSFYDATEDQWGFRRINVQTANIAEENVGDLSASRARLWDVSATDIVLDDGGKLSGLATSAEVLIDGGDVVNANTVTNADEVSNAVSALTVEYVETAQEVSVAGRVLNATEVATTDKLHADRVQEAEIVESAAQVTSAGSVGVAEYVEADTHIVNVETAETVETALNVVNVANPIQNAGRVVEAETVGTATSVERTENITSAFGSIQYVDTVENAISAGEVTTVLSASYIGWVDDVENAGTATTVTSAASVDYADAATTIHSAESVISANHIEAMASADEVETVISANYVTEVQNADIVRSANTVMSVGGSVTMDESGISANRVSETDAVGFIEANGDIVVPHCDLMRDKYIIVAETESETANVEIATGTMNSYSLDMILDFGSSSRKIDISLNGVKDSEHGIIKWIGTSPIASETKSLFYIRIVGVGEKVYGMEIGTGGTDYTMLAQGLLESQGNGSTVDGYSYPGTPEEKKVKSIPQDISKSVDILRGNAFPQFRFLETIDFPNCKVVWASAFSGCSSLTDVNLPECVSLAGASTFESCSSLVSVNIPKVKNLRTKTFFGCHSLEYAALDSCETLTIPFSDSRTQAMQAENLTSLTLPSIQTISSKAFGYSASQQYTGIQNLYIPNKTMQEIKNMANYATWYLSETCVIHASDGDFTYGA